MVLLGGTTTLDAPTTQSPADRVGQGGGQLDQPRFVGLTNARLAVEVEWNVTWRSWIWTYSPNHGVVTAMDEDTEDLIAQLCTWVGKIMEDTSERALMAQAIEPAKQREALLYVEREIQRCLALLSAAKSLRD